MSMAMAERFHRALVKVARYYQFRDRDSLVWHGITPTQCFSMYALEEENQMTMRALADTVGLDASSMTRAIDGLVDKKLVRRLDDPKDRRRCLIQLTGAGRKLHQKIRSSCVSQEGEILNQIDRSSRGDVVRAMELVVDYLEARDPEGQ